MEETETKIQGTSVIVEVSRPHYHPGPDFNLPLTKKRDLSQPGYWVANERIEKDGQSYAIVMPARDKELFEDRQEPHLHAPPSESYANGQMLEATHGEIKFPVKVKVHEGAVMRVHVDHIDAETYNLKTGDKITLNA
mgnify:CR=1 FL=1